MKDRTKKILLNIAMVATILVMVTIAVAVVGGRKGWFDDDSKQDISETVIVVDSEDNRKDDAYISSTEEKEDGDVATESIVEQSATTESTSEQFVTTEEQVVISPATTEAIEEQFTTEVTTEQSNTEATTEVTTEATTEETIEEIITTEDTTPSKTCIITIQCTSILNNMGKLKEGKEAYVPSSGYILSVAMDYTEGETVFDVLTRACSQYGVQLEYAYTPMYGSYYIEGINHLYEFDCGGTSGWKYSVNGSSPNYGCSNYTVSEDDSIVWYYVCE